MSEFAQVIGGLILLVVGIIAAVEGFKATFYIYILIAAFAQRGPRGEEVVVTFISFMIGIAGLFTIFLSLILLKPVVRFSFIPY